MPTRFVLVPTVHWYLPTVCCHFTITQFWSSPLSLLVEICCPSKLWGGVQRGCDGGGGSGGGRGGGSGQGGAGAVGVRARLPAPAADAAGRQGGGGYAAGVLAGLRVPHSLTVRSRHLPPSWCVFYTCANSPPVVHTASPFLQTVATGMPWKFFGGLAGPSMLDPGDSSHHSYTCVCSRHYCGLSTEQTDS